MDGFSVYIKGTEEPHFYNDKVAVERLEKRQKNSGFSMYIKGTEEPHFYSDKVAVERLEKRQKNSSSYGSRNDRGRRPGKRLGRLQRN